MSGDRTLPGERDPDLAAAEQALGLGPRGASALPSEREQAWTEHFASLWLDVAPQRPGPHVWSSIQRRLQMVRGSREAPRPRSRGRSILAGLLTGLATAAGLTAVAILGPLDLRSIVLGQKFVAILGPDTASPLFTAVVDARRGTLSFAPVTGAVQGPQVPQLWYVPSSGAPVSLGIIDPRRRTEITIPEPILRRWAPGESLAISLEPEGGSPTGAPTGPIIANGVVRALD
jgi:anti-sigma-K factor RskA